MLSRLCAVGKQRVATTIVEMLRHHNLAKSLGLSVSRSLGHVMNPLPACASAHLVQRDRMQVVQEGIAADR